MIKALLMDSTTGEPTMLLGLTDENIKRLCEGEPIRVNLSELGWSLVRCEPNKEHQGRVLIVQGKDERTLGAMLGFDVSNPGRGEGMIVRFDSADTDGHGHKGAE